MNYLSEKAKNYPTSVIREMFDMANDYDNVINLTLGEPNFDTPKNIIDAAIESLNRRETKYSANAGIDELRTVIAQTHNERYGTSYKKENVMVTIGAQESNFLTLLTIVNPGDEVIIPNPYYPNYEGQIMLQGAKPVKVDLEEENDFKMRPEDLEAAITSKTKAVMLNYPSNPLGAMLEKEDVLALAEVIKKHNILLLSDEVYDRLIFDDKPYFSFSQVEEIRDQVIIINSLSKTYAMTGWRVGYIIANEEIISNMPKIQEGILSCGPVFVQKAGIEALTGDQSAVSEMLSHYQRRRDILVEGLNKIPGFSCMKPKGTFYAFPNIEAFGKSSKEFAIDLLQKAQVLVVPGSAFGSAGEGYLRIIFATSDDALHEALERLEKYVKDNYKL